MNRTHLLHVLIMKLGFLECLLNVHYDNHESGLYCDRYTLSHVSFEIVLLVEHNNLREPSKGIKSHSFHERK